MEKRLTKNRVIIIISLSGGIFFTLFPNTLYSNKYISFYHNLPISETQFVDNGNVNETFKKGNFDNFIQPFGILNNYFKTAGFHNQKKNPFKNEGILCNEQKKESKLCNLNPENEKKDTLSNTLPKKVVIEKSTIQKTLVNSNNTISGTVFAGTNLLPNGSVLSFITGNNLIDKPLNPDTISWVFSGSFLLNYSHNNTSTIQVVPHFEIDPNHNPEYFPTYLGGKIYWEDALHFVPGYIDSLVVILAKRPNIFYGNGQIKGKIYPGDFSFEYFSHICVFLLDESELPLKYSLLDSDSSFTLTNIPDGSYYLLVDKFGIKSKPIPVSVTPENRMLLISYILGEDGFTHVAESEKSNFQVFPNPFTSEIHLNFDTTPGEESRHIAIFGITGNQIYSGFFDANQHSITIDLSNIKSGIYILKSRNNALKIIKK